MGNKNKPKLRLIDTQGLSDGRGEERDYENIREIVVKLRELNHIDLFLLCLEGQNPRMTHYLSQTIELFMKIFDDFLEHAVIVFNKWDFADENRLKIRQKEYQNLFKQKYQKQNVPCFFIDSHFNLKQWRTNDNGDSQLKYLPEKLQKKTEDQIELLLLFLQAKQTRCNVTKLEAKKPEKLEIKDERDDLHDMLYLFSELEQKKQIGHLMDLLMSTHSFLDSSCYSNSDWYQKGFKTRHKGSFGCTGYSSGSSSNYKSAYGAKEHAAEDFLRTNIREGKINRKDIKKYLGIKDEL